jgi:SulP family sulfate permease
MSTSSSAPGRPAPTFAELFTPKLITILREGYSLKDFRADAIAGLTVAIVALPLSMAIAVASGVGPERGLYTAIVGGFLISLLGGSRFQVGGPAGAFIVLVALIVQREGYDGLVLATVIAGIILIAVGFLRVGALIKYIPYPVTVGFTAGIAVIIVASQLRDLLGLEIAKDPVELLPKLKALWDASATAKLPTIIVGLASLAIIITVHRWRPAWPGFLIALVAASAVTAASSLDVATLGARFGAMPASLPAPSWPVLSWEKLLTAVPNGCAIALLGAIESLLSAVVADGMTGRRHRSNCELVAQGAANIGSVIFGGICATGTIARTATNVRAGARGPVSGMLHSVYLLLFVLVAAPLVAFIPLAALGAVLVVVAWNMADKSEFLSLLRSSPADALVLLTTFLLTVFVDLATAIMVGVALGAFLFLHRLAEAVEVASGIELLAEDRGDFSDARTAYDSAQVTDSEVMVYRISGALFFGATAALSAVLDRVGAPPKAFILDFSQVPLIDSTAANTLRGFLHKLAREHTVIYFAGARPMVKRALDKVGIDGAVQYVDTIAEAAHQFRARSTP